MRRLAAMRVRLPGWPALAAGLAAAAASGAGHGPRVSDVAPWLGVAHVAVALFAMDAEWHVRGGAPRDASRAAALPGLVSAWRVATAQWAGHACLAAALLGAMARVRHPGCHATELLHAAFGATACWGCVEGALTLALSFRILASTSLPEPDDDLA